MTWRIVPATKENVSCLIGLCGPSSSGKTFSALRLATGLANGGKIVGIDTEANRMRHYAERFQFDHMEFGEPFRPGRYQEAIKAAKDHGAAVIIVDSMSHEHEGPGGILDWHEEELKRMAGDDFAKRERVKFAAWIKPKQGHGLLVNYILQLGLHCIFCFRAKEKLVLVKSQRGAMEPVPIGWQPIRADRFEYEMTVNLMLPPGSKGVPDLDHDATKVPDGIDALIQRGQQIDEAMGQRLAGWAAGTKDPLLERAEAAAGEGLENYRSFFQGLTPAERQQLAPHHDRLKRAAGPGQETQEQPEASDAPEPEPQPSDPWEVVEDLQRDGAKITRLPGLETWRRTTVEMEIQKHGLGEQHVAFLDSWMERKRKELG